MAVIQAVARVRRDGKKLTNPGAPSVRSRSNTGECSYQSERREDETMIITSFGGDFAVDGPDQTTDTVAVTMHRQTLGKRCR